jgi:SIR2-like domain
MIDPITALAFSVYENKGVYALLLGSGVSRAAHIPTGWEVTLDLIKRIAALERIKDQADWAKWYAEKYGAEANYSALLDQLASTPDERRSVLHSYIEPTEEEIEEGRKVPTRAHHAIARLVRAGFIRVIITTNFDRLMENALREASIEPTVIKSDDDLKGAVPLTHSRCYLVKVHGDYLDTRIRNTDQELSAYSPEMNALLDRIIDEHGLIIAGWSGDWDAALRGAITRAPNRRYPLFFAARGKPSQIAADVVQHRAGRIITIESADSFFEDLEGKLSAQAELQRENPLSIELMVTSAKKYLGKPEFRIQLDKLIGNEAERLAKAIKEKEFEPSGAWSPERYAQTVARYEAVTEPLARIFGVLGRWGTGTEFAQAAEYIARFSQAEVVGGLTVLINLRTYPAVLLFYAYGIGLLKARRYGDLFKLFATTVPHEREPQPLVKRLLLGSWEGGGTDAWKTLEGLEKRKTPLSDHLHDVLPAWCTDFIFLSGEFTRLFEEFEMLAALAHLTLSTSLEDLQATLGKTGGRDFAWSPMGRAGWDGQTRRQILEDWAVPEINAAILKAGFANKSADYYKLAIDSISRLAEYMGWR